MQPDNFSHGCNQKRNRARNYQREDNLYYIFINFVSKITVVPEKRPGFGSICAHVLIFNLLIFFYDAILYTVILSVCNFFYVLIDNNSK